MKILTKIKNLVKRGDKEAERNEKKKNYRDRTVPENSKSFPVLSDSPSSPSQIKLALAKYKFAPQKKKGSFSGFAVKHNKKGRPYRGFISARIWAIYVADGETPDAEKVDFMIEVSKALREGYQEPTLPLPQDSREENPPSNVIPWKTKP